MLTSEKNSMVNAAWFCLGAQGFYSAKTIMKRNSLLYKCESFPSLNFIVELPALPSGSSVWGRLRVCDESLLPKEIEQLLPNKSIKHHLLPINKFLFSEFLDNLSQQAYTLHLILFKSDNTTCLLLPDAKLIFCYNVFNVPNQNQKSLFNLSPISLGIKCSDEGFLPH